MQVDVAKATNSNCGAGVVVLNVDHSSRSCGKVLVVHEKGVVKIPGGGVNIGETFAQGGCRELCEETTNGPADMVNTMIRLLGFFIVDTELSEVRHVTTRSGNTVTNGYVYAVITRNLAWPGESRDLPNNSETNRCEWLSLTELKALAQNGRFRGSIAVIEAKLLRLASKYWVQLA
jgi:8-oxo-dGTP pyrophosphatase MutT (NUDIX family)